MSQNVTEQAPAVFNEELGKESPDFNQGRNCRFFLFSQATNMCLRSSTKNIYLDHVV